MAVVCVMDVKHAKRLKMAIVEREVWSELKVGEEAGRCGGARMMCLRAFLSVVRW